MPIRKKIIRILNQVSGGKRTTTVSQKFTPPQQSTPTSPAVARPEPPVKQPQPSRSASPETATELVLYGRPSCPYCVRVDRVIEELDIEDKITRRLTTYGSEWRDDLRNRTGRTQVPCLFIDGEAMFESLDIIDWMHANLA